MHSLYPTTSRAFSLLELSITLLIIGLLAGGLFVGKNLVRSAELRSVTTEADLFITATSNFRNQYRGLPGDIINAANYWSFASTGDGNGQITGAERFQFWYQLNQAALIDKVVTGTQGSGGSDDFVIDDPSPNIPSSRASGAGFGAAYSNLAASTTTYAASMGNALTFGSRLGANTGLPLGAALTPEEALSIDSKVDDGTPGTGKWIANLAGGGAFGTATACTTDASGSVTTGAYNVTLTSNLCSFYIATGF